MCPQPACLAFLSPGPYGCFVGSALLSLGLLFFISLHLSSPFHLCFSLIRQPLSASLGCRRSELAGIVGTTCNKPPPSVLSATSQHHGMDPIYNSPAPAQSLKQGSLHLPLL